MIGAMLGDRIEVEEATPERGVDMVRSRVREELDISLEEFRNRLAQGAYDEPEQAERVVELILLLPFAR